MNHDAKSNAARKLDVRIPFRFRHRNSLYDALAHCLEPDRLNRMRINAIPLRAGITPITTDVSARTCTKREA